MGVTIVTIVVERFLAILVIKSWRAKTSISEAPRRGVSILGTSWAILFHKTTPLTGERGSSLTDLDVW